MEGLCSPELPPQELGMQLKKVQGAKEGFSYTLQSFHPNSYRFDFQKP